MKSKYDYNTIRDYLHGLVDRDTARDIRDLIRNDEVARNIAIGILQLEHEFNGDESEIESYIEGLRQKQLGLIKTKNKGRWISRDWVKLAAAILVIVVAVPVFYLITFSDKGADDLVMGELQHVYPLVVERSGSGESAETAAYQFYLDGEYEKAIQSFSQVEKHGRDSASVTFYNGLSHLYANKYDEAIVLLGSNSLAASRYQEQATWFYALALFKAGQTDDARNILDYIINRQPAHYKSTEARQLLEEMIESDPALRSLKMISNPIPTTKIPKR